MGIVERSGIWDCDDVIVEVSVGFGFYLVLLGQSN